MKISSSIDLFKRYGDKKAIFSLLKRSGFEAYDYTMEGIWGKPLDEILLADYRSRAKTIREISDSLGIVCNQTHAPFPSFLINDTTYTENMFSMLIRAIEVSAILGAKVCVMHPSCECGVKRNITFFKRLQPLAKEFGVKIALENLYACDANGKIIPASCSAAQDLRALLDGLSDDFGLCLDIGHSELTGGKTVEIIRELNDKIIALHLHDVDFIRDNHSLPFLQKVDYAPIIEALKEIKYSGDITLEVSLPEHLPQELVEDFVKYMGATAKFFKTALSQI